MVALVKPHGPKVREHLRAKPNPCYHQERAMEVYCQVDGCDRPIRCKSLCELHYRAMRRSCAPRCSVDGCDQPARNMGTALCSGHTHKLKRYGDPVAGLPRSRPGSDNPAWRGSAVSYNAAHTRVLVNRGAASSHVCVGCGCQAQDWAYRHDADPAPLVDRRGRQYSADPAMYQPMCTKCHRAFDK